MEELCQGQLLVGRDGSQLMMAVRTDHLKKEEREDGENLVCCRGKRKSGAKYREAEVAISGYYVLGPRLRKSSTHYTRHVAFRLFYRLHYPWTTSLQVPVAKVQCGFPKDMKSIFRRCSSIFLQTTHTHIHSNSSLE